MPNIRPIILAGGQGTRLWPLSTPERPKQFLRLPGQPSLFQQALQRVQGAAFEAPIIVCQANHLKHIRKELNETSVEAEVVLLETKPRNTATAIALASAWINKYKSEAEHCLIIPADQLITPIQQFQQAILQAATTSPESLNLFGLTPKSTSSQFGYIKTNSQGDVIGFEEKPSAERAEQLITQLNAYWNSGIFLMKSFNLHSWLQHWQPKLHQSTKLALDLATTNEHYITPDDQPLASLPSMPFDKAIIENGPNSGMPIHHTPLPCDWSDMGSWQAWHELALAQRSTSTTNRHWGYYRVLTEQPGYKVKQLTLRPGSSISYQKHQHRSEHWAIINGTAQVKLENGIQVIHAGEEITISPNQWHQLINTAKEELIVIETQVGDYLEEDDIIRS